MNVKKIARRSVLALAAAFLCHAAQAACLPQSNWMGMPQWAVSQNPKGCWVGWWCSPTKRYIAAATKQQCSLVGVQRAVAAWLRSPDPQLLAFGSDPFADPALRAVWEPEVSMLDAIKPEQ